MIVLEIVKKHLKKHGYDGLCGDMCGCSIDDICLCDENFSECRPAYKIINPDCRNCDSLCADEPADICYKPEKN